jgi:hypothetical protein
MNINQNLIGPTPAELIEEYVKLRDRKAEAAARVAEFMQMNFQQRINEIELALLDTLNMQGADSIKSPHGTAFKRVETSVTVADAAEFRRHVIGTEQWDLLDIRANKTAVRDFVENHDGNLPPGINMTQDTVVSVRRSTPKD